MCLVSYVPSSQGFILSSNRDESPLRRVHSLQEEQLEDRKIFYPADVKGGSWIFISDRADILCLLNGAYEKHHQRGDYKMSRGMVLRAYFQYSDAIDFLENFNFWEVEPFTLIIKSKRYFLEFRWDGQIKHVKQLDNKKEYVWSSCTLYNDETIAKREKRFKQYLNSTTQIDKESIGKIHLSKNSDDHFNGFVMNRQNLVKTISFTQIVFSSHDLIMTHTDLETGEKDEKVIECLISI